MHAENTNIQDAEERHLVHTSDTCSSNSNDLMAPPPPSRNEIGISGTQIEAPPESRRMGRQIRIVSISGAIGSCISSFGVILGSTLVIAFIIYSMDDVFGHGNTRKHIFGNAPADPGYNGPNHHPKRYSNYPFNNATVEQIVLLGERNSGTNWVTSLLASCFPDIPVSTYLAGWKHWFQEDLKCKGDARTDHPDCKYVDIVQIKTFVVQTVLNPYDWVEGMRLTPRDYPNHMKMKWNDFVTTPWTMRRPARDIIYENHTGRLCQYAFRYNEVIPCHLDKRKMGKRARNERYRNEDKRNGVIRYYPSIYGDKFQPPANHTGASSPVYEMRRDGSGEPYASLVDMRSDKLRNHLNVAKWKWIHGHELAHFDRMADPEYLWEFLHRIEKHVGLNATCSNIPLPKWKTKKYNENATKEFMDWITDRVDWETEALVGYVPDTGPV